MIVDIASRAPLYVDDKKERKEMEWAADGFLRWAIGRVGVECGWDRNNLQLVN